MKALISIGVFIIFISGCVTKNPITNSSYMGTEQVNGVSHEQMYKQLTRIDAKSSMGLAGNEMLLARITPITTPLIIAEEKEVGKKQLRSDADTKKVIGQKTKELVNMKPCFWITVQTSGELNNAQFKNWVGKVRTKSGDLIDIEFDNVTGVKSVPNSRATAWDHNVYQWENFTGACAKSNFNRTEDFAVVLSNSIMKKVDNLELKWTFAK